LRIDVKNKEKELLHNITRESKEIHTIMGDNGSRPISRPTAVTWYEHHPTRPSGKSLPILTIIFWVSEDGSLSQAVGWLKEAIPDELRFKKLDQAVHRHIAGILAEMSQSGLVHEEEGKVALAKKE
jgi:hypothetical protein